MHPQGRRAWAHATGELGGRRRFSAMKTRPNVDDRVRVMVTGIRAQLLQRSGERTVACRILPIGLTCNTHRRGGLPKLTLHGRMILSRNTTRPARPGPTEWTEQP